MKILGFLFAFSTLLFSNELEKTLEELQANHRKLEGFLATYESTNQKNQRAVFEIGIDRKSGWSLIRVSLKGKKNEIIQSQEVWATENGEYLTRNGGQVVVFEGFEELMARFREFQQLLRKPDQQKQAKPAFLSPWVFLTEEKLEFGMGLGLRGPRWLTIPEKVLKVTDSEVHLGWDDHGTIVIDRSSGLIKSQEIHLEDGKRTMKLVEVKKNPGARAFSSQMTFDLKGARKKDLSETGLGRGLLQRFMQEVIIEAGKSGEKDPEIDDLFEKMEEGLLDFLGKESLDKAPFVKKEVLNGLIETFITKVQDLAAGKGQEVEAAAILGDVSFRNQLENDMANALIQRAPPELKKLYLRETLGGDLKARGRKELEALRKVETFLQKVYYRTRIRKAIDNFLEK